MSITNLCDCSSNGYPLYQPARCMSCGCSATDCSNGVLSNINLKATERRIQNQTGVHESQYVDVLGAFTIASNYLDLSANTSGNGNSSVWGNKFNLSNQSDRRIPHGMPFVNVPTRGNSTKSTITANKPGAMTPGGYGVDVKHGSYARYLGKLKGRTLALPNLGDISSSSFPYPKAPINNKTWRFSLMTTHNCNCDGKLITN